MPFLTMMNFAKSLETLNLSGNRIKWVKSLLYYGGTATDLLTPMEKLKQFRISGSNVRLIDDDAFDYMPNLEIIDLKRNQLIEMPPGLAIPSIRELDISYQCVKEDECPEHEFKIPDGVFATSSKESGSIRMPFTDCLHT